MFKRIIEDIRVAFKRDPAARNVMEILICYPGLHAIWMHRIAHWFYKRRSYIWARIISHIARHFTGIEIHPGAEIGRRFFIDHGMGIVIGETSEIGEDCLLYQGVVLGGTTIEKKKRHPTLGNNVVVGAGATLLGAIKIGDNARVGAGSVVVNDVLEGATVVGIPARVGVGFSRKAIKDLEHGRLPDPVADAVKFMLEEFGEIDERLKKIESAEGITTRIDKFVEEKKREIEKEFNSRQLSENERYKGGEGI